MDIVYHYAMFQIKSLYFGIKHSFYIPLMKTVRPVIQIYQQLKPILCVSSEKQFSFQSCRGFYNFNFCISFQDAERMTRCTSWQHQRVCMTGSQCMETCGQNELQYFSMSLYFFIIVKHLYLHQFILNLVNIFCKYFMFSL